METHLAGWISDTPAGKEAEAILRTCVHCGFCTATCPTYQLLGDELDGPRGRIYQIKRVLEGAPATRSAQRHLDRCLTCTGCETVCPSGVRYGRLLEIGRRAIDERVRRPWPERLQRAGLHAVLTRRWLFAALVAIARAVAPLLPKGLSARVQRPPAAGSAPARAHARRVLLLASCTQGALLPSIDRATARVLDALGVGVVVEPRSGCCGALHEHLGDPVGAEAAARRNVDAWWPALERGCEAIVMTASGCGVRVKEYGHLLRGDPAYAERAAAVAAKTLDLVEWLAPALERGPPFDAAPMPLRVAFHSPCTLQHGQKIQGRVEAVLSALGAELTPVSDSHLCCGSAGPYSLLQPALSGKLRTAKLAGLAAGAPDMILSANVGCIAHLAGATAVPVRHWIEWVDGRLHGLAAREARP